MLALSVKQPWAELIARSMNEEEFQESVPIPRYPRSLHPVKRLFICPGDAEPRKGCCSSGE